jgi:hypothetical protein
LLSLLVSYNASAVKIYNATSGLHSAFLKTKILSSTMMKRASLLQRERCSCKFRCRRIGSRCTIHYSSSPDSINGSSILFAKFTLGLLLPPMRIKVSLQASKQGSSPVLQIKEMKCCNSWFWLSRCMHVCNHAIAWAFCCGTPY